MFSVKKWQNDKKLDLLGMPHYIANGSHLIDETRYRFLVLPRYEIDIEKILRSTNSHVMHLRNVLILSAQIIDVLEYLHSQGYVHSDIKSSNLMVGFDGSTFRNNKQQRKIKKSITLSKKCDSKNAQQKIKYSSYYYDEDFVLHNYLSSNSNTDYETDEDTNVGKRNTKYIHPPKSSKTKLPLNNKNIRVKGFFNLRKLKSDVNYEDLNSSICSHDSYQDLIENNAKNRINFTQPDQVCNPKCSDNDDDNEINHFEEAICSQSPGQVYLLDYGLASKFVNSDGSHKEFVMDQRKAHDGTLEYSSRDSHIGAHSRRSDLENLGYNILDWLAGNLPWKTPKMLQDPNIVHVLKNNCMEDIGHFMEACFKAPYPKFIEKYFLYVKKLEFHEKPDYRFCKNLFINEFRDRGFGTVEDMTLNFKSDENLARKKINYSKKINPCKNTPPDFLKRNAIMKVYGRENLQGNSWENDLKMDLIRESLSNDGIRKPCVSRNFFISDADLISKLRQTLLITHDTTSKKFSPKNLRSTKCVIKKKKGGRNNKSNIGKFGNFLGSEKQYTWAEILAGNPESFMRKSEKDKNGQTSDVNEKGHGKKPRSRKVSNASEISANNVDINSSPILLNRDYLSSLNPTYAMKEVVENYHRKTSGKANHKTDDFERVSNEHGYTSAMIRVIKVIEKREKKERLLAAKEEKKNEAVSTLCKKNTKMIKTKSIGRRKSLQNNVDNVQLPIKDVASKKTVNKINKKVAKPSKDDGDNINTSMTKSDVPVRKLRCRTVSSVKISLENVQESDKIASDTPKVNGNYFSCLQLFCIRMSIIDFLFQAKNHQKLLLS